MKRFKKGKGNNFQRLIKPVHTFLFIFCVFIVLSALLYIFPENGLFINNKISIRYPNPAEILKVQKPVYKDISEIVNNFNPDKSTREDYFKLLANYNKQFYSITFDTIQTPTVKVLNEHKKADKQGSNKFTNSYPVELPGSNKTILYSFFDALKNLQNSNELIRVLHYGDSQIEGDRITSFIRNELQKKFGGSGIGMFPVVITSEYILSVKHEISQNWKRYAVNDPKNTEINHKRYGIMLSFSRFTPPELVNDEKIMESYINIEKSDISYDLSRTFTKCRLFYGFNRKPLVIEIYKNDKLYDAEILLPNNQLQVNEWNFDEPGTELSIRFRGEDSPDIFAVSLDNSKGVAVDNIPLRGSKGLDFNKTDLTFLKEMYNKLNVKLIILQFGVNMVPLMADNYKFYEEQLYDQLIKLKEMNPDISIIVLGISDMSRSNRGIYETYPNIKKILQAQKNATFRAGCAFWSIFDAMGGENSMPSWVNHDPPLARTDYTHFSFSGSKLIAQMFYNSLMIEYNKYLNK